MKIVEGSCNQHGWSTYCTCSPLSQHSAKCYIQYCNHGSYWIFRVITPEGINGRTILPLPYVMNLDAKGGYR